MSREISLPCSRRALLAGAGSVAAALWPRPASAFLAPARFSGYPFTLGVVSGDPTPDGVVLWTRLAPRPTEGGGMPPEAVEVHWQVAEDEGMTRVVRQGKATARPELAHSVHVEVTGLSPSRWYWYQFKAGNEVSPKARTRTLPDSQARPGLLRFAFASCQHYESGLFTAYQHMAREDLDLVAHLGDYIYEGAGRAGQTRRHVGPVLTTVDDYRNRYAQYRLDPALQAVHHAAPWIVTWDDHEVANNYAADVAQQADVSRADFLRRRAAAYQAYYEHMPLRADAIPHGPDLKLYRRLSWGRLAQFFVLDTRQYRTDQPNGDGLKDPGTAALDPRGTLLGTPQREWLFNRLERSAATWNILAQQVMMARVDRVAGPALGCSMDQWPGYEYERRRVLQHLRESGVSNPVVLTGDIHTNWANELILDPEKLDSPVVAAEFVGTSISSGGDGAHSLDRLAALQVENPFVKFHNGERGYVRCEVTPEGWRADYQTVPYITRPGAPRRTRASFALERGSSKLRRA